MQNWTSEMWQIAGISLVVGVIIGYFLVRLTKGSVKKQLETENELKAVKEQVSNQKQELEKHFSESAELLKNLAQDYQKLYQHLASSSTKLLPNSEQQALFSQNLITNESQEASAETGEHINPARLEPKDYSEGSSGLLKAER
ncbi:YhcB family protein [Conservatibacter flavescens]|uniref:Z-ring associated protein G n=1 Tax=Conservatibacter flavescens TaxID=28161 RepID=A0A2M8S5U3_9PAST|nr:DUF1043 family protein [Conservatibacter flavescens]PJG86535.1 DUF1043 domain-containing protein [Conservatibacter flavescens]